MCVRDIFPHDMFVPFLFGHWQLSALGLLWPRPSSSPTLGSRDHRGEAVKLNHKKNPLNPGCLIGILISWFIIIPTYLGFRLHPLYILNYLNKLIDNQAFFQCSVITFIYPPPTQSRVRSQLQQCWKRFKFIDISHHVKLPFQIRL